MGRNKLRSDHRGVLEKFAAGLPLGDEVPGQLPGLAKVAGGRYAGEEAEVPGQVRLIEVAGARRHAGDGVPAGEIERPQDTLEPSQPDQRLGAEAHVLAGGAG